MELTILGSGLTITRPELPYRYPSAHLVEVGDKKLLLDSGIGVLPQIAKLGLNITDIDTICISHYHADHFNLEPILQAYYLTAGRLGTKPAIQILGPPDIEERVRTGYRLKGFNYDNDLLERIDIKFTPYSDGDKIALDDGLSLTPFKTNHFEVDAYALRLENNDRTLTYSGDSAATDSLRSAAKDADTFLCEAGLDIGAAANSGHMSPKDAGQVAAGSNSKRLIIVHYSGNNNEVDMIKEKL